MDLNLALSVFAVALLGSVGAIGYCLTFFFVSKHSKCTNSSGGEPNIIQAILNKDDVQFSHIRSPLIVMPDSLETHTEMVAWMTEELPRLTADLMRSKI